MKKIISWVIPVFIVLISVLSISQVNEVGAAAKYKDGEYSVPFTILKGDSDDRSMTNDYVTTPAKLIVKDGKNTIQIAIKNSSWWQFFKLNGADGTVISKDDGADTEVVQFVVDDLEQTVPSNIHVIVPDIDYDNKYNIRFKFDTSNVATTSVGENAPTNESAGKKEVEKNPPTGDHTPILFLTLMLAGSGLILVRKLITS